jgi:hypothetical protein
MERMRMPVRVLGRECDGCEEIGDDLCPVKHITHIVRSKVDDPTFTMDEAQELAEELGIVGLDNHYEGATHLSNGICPHRIEEPRDADLILIQVKIRRKSERS